MNNILNSIKEWLSHCDKGLKYSIALHIAVLMFIVFGVPSLDLEMNKDVVVSVEITAISELSNLKNFAVHDKKEQTPGKSEEVKPQKSEESEKPQEKPEAAEQKIEPDEKKDEIALNKKKAEDKKKEEETKKKQAKEKAKKQAEKKVKNELDSMLKNLEEESVKRDDAKVKKPTKQNDTSDNKSMSNRQFDESMPLSMSEKDAIKAQIERKFSNPVAMQFNPGELVVKIRFTLNADGTVLNATSLTGIYPAQYSNAYQSISEGLIRAAYSASPLQGISRGDEIILTFDAYYLMNG